MPASKAVSDMTYARGVITSRKSFGDLKELIQNRASPTRLPYTLLTRSLPAFDRRVSLAPHITGATLTTLAGLGPLCKGLGKVFFVANVMEGGMVGGGDLVSMVCMRALIRSSRKDR